MGLPSLLHPNLMTTDDLRSHLKKRFPTQGLDGLHRAALLKLFETYAAPMARRNANSKCAENINDSKPTEKTNLIQTNGNKRRNHQLIVAPSIETVTNACKKIKLANSNGANRSCLVNNRAMSVQKRPYEMTTDSPMECDADIDDNRKHPPSIETKRKKITWP